MVETKLDAAQVGLVKVVVQHWHNITIAKGNFYTFKLQFLIRIK